MCDNDTPSYSVEYRTNQVCWGNGCYNKTTSKYIGYQVIARKIYANRYCKNCLRKRLAAPENFNLPVYKTAEDAFTELITRRLL